MKTNRINFTLKDYGMVKRECPSLIGVGVCQNDETKHLIGTTDDAPEKYKTW